MFVMVFMNNTRKGLEMENTGAPEMAEACATLKVQSRGPAREGKKVEKLLGGTEGK